MSCKSFFVKCPRCNTEIRGSGDFDGFDGMELAKRIALEQHEIGCPAVEKVVRGGTAAVSK